MGHPQLWGRASAAQRGHGSSPDRHTDRQTCPLPARHELDSFNAALTATQRAPAVPRNAQACTAYTWRNTHTYSSCERQTPAEGLGPTAHRSRATATTHSLGSRAQLRSSALTPHCPAAGQHFSHQTHPPTRGKANPEPDMATAKQHSTTHGCSGTGRCASTHRHAGTNRGCAANPRSGTQAILWYQSPALAGPSSPEPVPSSRALPRSRCVQPAGHTIHAHRLKSPPTSARSTQIKE